MIVKLKTVSISLAHAFLSTLLKDLIEFHFEKRGLHFMLNPNTVYIFYSRRKS